MVAYNSSRHIHDKQLFWFHCSNVICIVNYTLIAHKLIFSIKGTYESQRMNIWEGTFPEGNNLEDGYHGGNMYQRNILCRPLLSSLIPVLHLQLMCSHLFCFVFPATIQSSLPGLAPVKSYPPQTPSGLYNLLGNVWEWALEGNGKKRRDQGRSSVKPLAENQRVLRGGSFVDSYVVPYYLSFTSDLFSLKPFWLLSSPINTAMC